MLSTTPFFTCFDTIDADGLVAITGGEAARRRQEKPQDHPNYLQRAGRNMQTGGEYAMAAGAAATMIPGLGETGLPEGIAAGGGAAWLLGKGVEGIGSLVKH